LASGLIAAEGPVTCLIVRGNRAGFIYPVKVGKPSFIEDDEIYIAVQDGGPHGPDFVTFVGPARKGVIT
ncbi:MAG: hypothetical protein JO100_13960, partial [Pseudonocardia sp.]|nr:hypothetical protein [Pseudonocardia sp.]